VTIKGQIDEEKKETKGTMVRQELRYGLFERAIELPMTIDPTKVEAKYEHGMLTLVLPKSDVVKPKLIPVKVL
jgi:HSP20 family protein